MASKQQVNQDFRMVERLLCFGGIIGCVTINFQNTQKVHWLRRIYTVIIFVLLTAIAFYALMFKVRQFGGEETLTRLVGNIFEEFLVTMSILTLIYKLNCSNAYLWRDFLKMISFLQKTLPSTSSSERPALRRLIDIIILHILFISVYFYEVYFSWERRGVHKLFRILTYYFYFVLCLIHHIVKLIKGYFDELQSRLDYIDRHILHEYRKVVQFSEIGRLYMKIVEVIKKFNELFGWQMFFASNIAVLVIANDIHIQIYKTNFGRKVLDRLYFGLFPVIQIVSRNLCSEIMYCLCIRLQVIIIYFRKV